MVQVWGYLAARSVAFEHRISDCLHYNRVYDGYDAFVSSLPEPC